MTERTWRFGDVVRVDPAKSPVPQPDDRRWMIVAFDNHKKWTTTLILGNSRYAGQTTHWTSMTGFIRVEDDE